MTARTLIVLTVASSALVAAVPAIGIDLGSSNRVQWSRLTDLPGGQHAACGAVVDGLIYLVGGQNPSGPPNYNHLRIYDPAASTWSDGPAMFTRRYLPGAGVIDGPDGKELYVVGGYSGYGGLATVERYMPDTGQWESVAPITGNRGHGVMTAVVHNELYAMGGFWNYTPDFDTNEVYDRQNNRWIHRAPISRDGRPFPLQLGATSVRNDRIYVFGGVSPDGALDTTLIYDTVADTWSTGAAMPRQRGAAKAFALDDRIYVMGGLPAGPDSALIDVYDPMLDRWLGTQSYPGANFAWPVVAQGPGMAYLLSDSHGSSGALEAWVAIPEPTTMLLVAAAGMPVLCRRRTIAGHPSHGPRQAAAQAKGRGSRPPDQALGEREACRPVAAQTGCGAACADPD